MVNRFTDKQINVLKALAKYKFLTYDQILRLGIAKHKSNLSSLINELISDRKSYIEKIPHRPGIPAKFYLTKNGRDILLEYTDLTELEIQMPSTKLKRDTQDQKHRTRLIDIQIAIELSVKNQNIELMFLDRYFDTVGNNKLNKNLKSKTSIPTSKTSIKADMIFKLQTALQEELYVLELENGKDTKKSVTKCKEHAQTLFEGSVHDKYDFKKGYRTLWVFEHTSTMKSTISRIVSDPFFENIHEYFLFSSLEKTCLDFFVGWVNIQNFDRKLFYL